MTDSILCVTLLAFLSSRLNIICWLISANAHSDKTQSNIYSKLGNPCLRDTWLGLLFPSVKVWLDWKNGSQSIDLLLKPVVIKHLGVKPSPRIGNTIHIRGLLFDYKGTGDALGIRKGDTAAKQFTCWLRLVLQPWLNAQMSPYPSKWRGSYKKKPHCFVQPTA